MKRRQRAASAVRLELLVEEESAYRLLQPVLRGWLPTPGVHVKVRPFQGRPDLLGKLPARLRGYADARERQGVDYRVAVLVDRDDDDCRQMKGKLEDIASKAGLVSRRVADGKPFNVVTRIAVRELENWYFGDWPAVRAAFPKIQPQTAPGRYRSQADADAQKTSEAFERMLRRGGIALASKPAWAERMAPHMDPDRNRSPSFRAFIVGVREMVQR